MRKRQTVPDSAETRALARLLATTRRVELSAYDLDALILAGFELSPQLDLDGFHSSEVYQRGRGIMANRTQRYTDASDAELEAMAEGFSLEDMRAEFVAAWERRLPELPCPIRIEGGKVFHRLKPSCKHSPLPLYGEDRDGWRQCFLTS